MKFSKIILYPDFPREIIVQWDLENAIHPGQYLFDVERSGSPIGPFEKLNSEPLIDEFKFHDTTLPLITKLVDVYYRVIVTPPLDSKLISDSINLIRQRENRQYLIGKEINRQEKILLKHAVGVPCKVFKRRHWGTRCPDCFNFLTKEVTDKNCASCFGTGFTGGYYPFIDTFIHFDTPVPRSQEVTDQFATVENIVTTGWTIAYPLLKKDDIIVDDVNKRWYIHTVNITELRRAHSRQLMDLREVTARSILYDLPA